MSIITCRSHLSRGVPELLLQRSADSVFNYVGGQAGDWRITSMKTLGGHPLAPVTHLEISNGPLRKAAQRSTWTLRAVANRTRYVAREDREPHDCKTAWQLPQEATCAALIAIRKSAIWSGLGDGEPRQNVQTQPSRMNRTSRILPALIRRLQPHRVLDESFDFVTWFQYSPADTQIADALVAALRASDEWRSVEREVDIRLRRER